MPSTPLSPEELSQYRFPRAAVKRLEQWSNEDTYDNLLSRHDGPFGEYGTVGPVSRDGKEWMRMQLAMTDALVDLEILANGYIGQVVPVPPEEAARIARGASQG